MLTHLKKKTKPTIYLIVIFLLFYSLPFNSSGQSDSLNLDFSLGNFTHWEGYYGTFYHPNEHKGILPGRHLIIQGPGSLDPLTCNGLNTVAPEELHSVRLGNSHVDAEAEQLRYTLKITR